MLNTFLCIVCSHVFDCLGIVLDSRYHRLLLPQFQVGHPRYTFNCMHFPKYDLLSDFRSSLRSCTCAKYAKDRVKRERRDAGELLVKMCDRLSCGHIICPLSLLDKC